MQPKLKAFCTRSLHPRGMVSCLTASLIFVSLETNHKLIFRLYLVNDRVMPVYYSDTRDWEISTRHRNMDSTTFAKKIFILVISSFFVNIFPEVLLNLQLNLLVHTSGMCQFRLLSFWQLWHTCNIFSNVLQCLKFCLYITTNANFCPKIQTR